MSKGCDQTAHMRRLICAIAGRTLLEISCTGSYLFFLSAVILIINFFEKFFLIATLWECQTVWIQIRTDILLILIWVKTVCKSYQQMSNSPIARKIIECFPSPCCSGHSRHHVGFREMFPHNSTNTPLSLDASWTGRYHASPTNTDWITVSR